MLWKHSQIIKFWVKKHQSWGFYAVILKLLIIWNWHYQMENLQSSPWWPTWSFIIQLYQSTYSKWYMVLLATKVTPVLGKILCCKKIHVSFGVSGQAILYQKASSRPPGALKFNNLWIFAKKPSQNVLLSNHMQYFIVDCIISRTRMYFLLVSENC